MFPHAMSGFLARTRHLPCVAILQLIRDLLRGVPPTSEFSYAVRGDHPTS